MQVSLDGTVMELPRAENLADLLDGLAPHVDPARDVTGLEVDGRPADPTDRPALSAWALTGAETIRIVSETPLDFARSRRAAMGEHLRHVFVVIEAAARELRGGDAPGGNRLLAIGTRDLSLLLELDQNLTLLDATAARCTAVVDVLQRCGEQLTAAGKGERWGEVARLLESELLPALKACAEA
jgi:hypothetical protein